MKRILAGSILCSLFTSVSLLSCKTAGVSTTKDEANGKSNEYYHNCTGGDKRDYRMVLRSEQKSKSIRWLILQSKEHLFSFASEKIGHLSTYSFNPDMSYERTDSDPKDEKFAMMDAYSVSPIDKEDPSCKLTIVIPPVDQPENTYEGYIKLACASKEDVKLLKCQVKQPEPIKFANPIYLPTKAECNASLASFKSELKRWNADVECSDSLGLGMGKEGIFVITFPTDQTMVDYFKSYQVSGGDPFNREIPVAPNGTPGDFMTNTRDGSRSSANARVYHITKQADQTVGSKRPMCKSFHLCDGPEAMKQFIDKYWTEGDQLALLLGSGFEDSMGPFGMLYPNANVGPRCGIGGSVANIQAHIKFLETRMKAGSSLTNIEKDGKCFHLVVRGY